MDDENDANVVDPSPSSSSLTLREMMMMTGEVVGLKGDATLYHLMRIVIDPGTGVNAERFWKSLGEIVRDLRAQKPPLLH